MTRAKALLALAASSLLLLASAQMNVAQVYGQGQGKDKKEEKKLEKEARKLASKAEDADKELGRNVV